jgi:hypothetical protein
MPNDPAIVDADSGLSTASHPTNGTQNPEATVTVVVIVNMIETAKGELLAAPCNRNMST